MSTWKMLLAVLFFIFVWVIWGPILTGLLLFILVTVTLFFLKTGRWPWTFLVLAVNKTRNKNLIISESKPEITFSDVAGLDEAKDELLEIVDFLKNGEFYRKVGARLPRGVLMFGPPGVGKTLLARAVAGEANVFFIEISASAFVNKFVGVGADNIRGLFTRARAKAPCIIFVDEFDSLGSREVDSSAGDREYNQTINEMLVQMDGFASSKNVIVLAATNRPDKIDKAFLRPGRFDRQIYFGLPDINGREAILKVHARDKPLDDNVNLRDIAKSTAGFSGADLANLLNLAAIKVGKIRGQGITQQDILDSRDKVTMGSEKKSMIIGPKEKRVTAYHESGHAFLAAILEHCDPPDKVTVIPRNMALGATSLVTETDRYQMTRLFLADRLVMLMGGRAAEKIACDSETSGARDDIAKATEIATAMICEYGMSDFLGPAIVPKNSKEAQAEIRKLLKESEKRAMDLIEKNLGIVHSIAELLLQKETISGDEIFALLNKKP